MCDGCVQVGERDEFIMVDGRLRHAVVRRFGACPEAEKLAAREPGRRPRRRLSSGGRKPSLDFYDGNREAGERQE